MNSLELKIAKPSVQEAHKMRTVMNQAFGIKDTNKLSLAELTLLDRILKLI